MKKIILLILIICFSQEAEALEIENIAISTISDQQINVAVNTNHEYVYQYITHQYSNIGNVITLDICYGTGALPSISYLENNFQIPLNTLILANYSLIVKVYFVNFQTFICDYQIIRDMENLTFSTPLSGTVFLTVNDVPQNKINSILYPNPTKGMLFCNKKIKIKRIQVYNFSSQLIYKIEKPENEFDLSSLQDGSYLVRIETEDETYVEKIFKK